MADITLNVDNPSTINNNSTDINRNIVVLCCFLYPHQTIGKE